MASKWNIHGEESRTNKSKGTLGREGSAPWKHRAEIGSHLWGREHNTGIQKIALCCCWGSWIPNEAQVRSRLIAFLGSYIMKSLSLTIWAGNYLAASLTTQHISEQTKLLWGLFTSRRKEHRNTVVLWECNEASMFSDTSWGSTWARDDEGWSSQQRVTWADLQGRSKDRSKCLASQPESDPGLHALHTH